MLNLTRRVGQKILIGNPGDTLEETIEVLLRSCGEKVVVIGVQADQGVNIRREELEIQGRKPKAITTQTKEGSD